MLDPESAHLRIRTGKCQAVLHHRMGEKGRVKIKAHAFFLRELHPFREMLRLQLVTVRILSLFKNSIGSMHIDFLLTRNHGDCLVHIRHQFFRRPGLSRIISCCLDSSRQRPVMVKPRHVIPLPAMHGYRHFLQGFKRRICVHPNRCKHFLRGCISFCCCHFSFSFSLYRYDCFFTTL